MTRDAKVFIIHEESARALADAKDKKGCFANEWDWAINIWKPRLFVLSVSDAVDEALVREYAAKPLSESDGYRTVLKNPRNIHLGESGLTAFLEIK